MTFAGADVTLYLRSAIIASHIVFFIELDEGKIMISLTKSAKDRLRSLSQHICDQTETVLRLTLNERGQHKFVPDCKREGDQVIEYQGVPLLVVDGTVSVALEGLQIDFVDNDKGQAWVLTKPQTEEKAGEDRE